MGGVTVAEVWVCLLTSDLSLPDDSGDEEPAAQSDRSEIQGTLKILVSKLDDLSTCNDLIAKHGAALQRSLSELEGLKIPLEGGEKIKAVNERATLFRITSNAMINVSTTQADKPNVVKVTNTGVCWQKPIVTITTTMVLITNIGSRNVLLCGCIPFSSLLNTNSFAAC